MEDKPKEFIAPIGQQKKKSSWAKYFVLAIIAVMVLWVIAIAFQDRIGLPASEPKKPSNLIQVGSYEFYILEDNTFGTFLNAGDKKIPIAFRLDPREAGNIALDTSVIAKILQASKIYIVFNPNEQKLYPAKFAIASAEISRITGLYQIPTIAAYSEDSNPVNLEVPVRTCADAGGKTAVIILTAVGGKTGISLADGDCITVAGADADSLILASDKLGLNLVGIRL